MKRFHHICEICGRDEILSPSKAFEAGWNYPPRMGHFGTISDRLCGKCPSSKATVWWAIAEDGFTTDMLTDKQRAVVARIQAEPESLMLTPEEAAAYE